MKHCTTHPFHSAYFVLGCVCVCVSFVAQYILDVSRNLSVYMGASARVTHIGVFFLHFLVPDIFMTRRSLPSLSFVDVRVEYCVLAKA